MNLSRPFILRPVATALLMAALLLSGILVLPAAAGVGAAAGRLPDDPHHHLLPGRQPRGDDELGDGAARAPVRAAAGPGADVVDQFGRRVGDHAALRARQAAQRRRAGSAGGDERRQQPAAERPAAAAGLQQGQPGRHAGADAGGDVGHGAAAADLRPDRHARGAEAVAAARRRPGQHRRRPAAGRAHPGQPAGAGLERPQPAEHPRGHRRRQRQPAEGQLRRAAAVVHARRQRSAALARGLQGPHRRLPRRRADPPAATSPTSSTAPRTAACRPGPTSCRRC